MKGKIHIDDFAFRIQRRIEQIAQHEDNQYIGCRREVVEDSIVLTPQLSENGEIKEYGGLVFFTSEERVAIVNQAQCIVRALLAAFVREQRQPEYFSDGLEFVDIDYEFGKWVYEDKDGVEIEIAGEAEYLALYKRRFLDEHGFTEAQLQDLVGKVVGIHVIGGEYILHSGRSCEDGVFIIEDITIFREVSKVVIDHDHDHGGIRIELEFVEPINLVPVDVGNLNEKAGKYNVCLHPNWIGCKIYPDDCNEGGKQVPSFRMYVTPDRNYITNQSALYEVDFYLTLNGDRLGYAP